jgi:hypothetical protein
LGRSSRRCPEEDTAVIADSSIWCVVNPEDLPVGHSVEVKARDIKDPDSICVLVLNKKV